MFKSPGVQQTRQCCFRLLSQSGLNYHTRASQHSNMGDSASAHEYRKQLAEDPKPEVNAWEKQSGIRTNLALDAYSRDQNKTFDNVTCVTCEIIRDHQDNKEGNQNGWAMI